MAERTTGGGRRNSRFRRLGQVGAVLASAALLAACNSTSGQSRLGVSASERVVKAGQPVPRGGGTYKVGKPYKVAGRWFHPEENPGYDSTGMASWYGSAFHGRKTANGEIFDMNALTAAHPTLPLPTYARVTNLENGSSVVVRVNDRGPFAHNRLIDLSKRTAEVLGFTGHGTAEVRVQYVGAAPLEGGDEWLTTTVRNDGETVAPVMLASAQGQPPQTATPTPQPRPMTIEDLIADEGGGPVLAMSSSYVASNGTAQIDDAFALFKEPQSLSF